jgi:glycosyltransferase involved in cell wall biosynthesis
VVCDDASSDQSLAEARIVAAAHDSITLISSRPNGQKVRALQRGLAHTVTPYVLLLDADCMVHESVRGGLDDCVNEMERRQLSAMAFRIRPKASNAIEQLQRLEYLLFTDGIRRLLGVVVCLVGQAVIWNADDLRRVLTQHSGSFEGDDLECTMVAATMRRDGSNLDYDRSRVFSSTTLKRTVRELIRQRAHIWDVGLIRSFFDAPGVLLTRGRYGVFFRAILITEVFAHVFKLLSLPAVVGFLCGLVLLHMRSENEIAWWGTDVVTDVADVCLDVLIATSFVYFGLWLANIASVVWGEWHAPKRLASMVLYVTAYMVLPLAYVFIVPLASDAMYELGPDRLQNAYWTFGPVASVSYVWWWLMSIVVVFSSSEKWSAKTSLARWSLLMPLYFLCLILVARTYGFTMFFRRRLFPHGAVAPE